MAVYTDRAHWAFHTPQAGGPVDKDRRTQVGRALARLGIEHIGAYSPQARGRSERLNRTFQDRLVNELRVAKITTLETANAYLRERFVPDYNATFQCAPADPASAFVALGRVDLDQLLCHEEERVVAADNTVSMDGYVFQVARQPGRRTCAGRRVVVRRHLSGGVFDLARYRIASGGIRRGSSARGIAAGRCSLWPLPAPWTARCASPAPWKTPSPRVPQLHRLRAKKRSDHLSNESGQITCHNMGRTTA